MSKDDLIFSTDGKENLRLSWPVGNETPITKLYVDEIDSIKIVGQPKAVGWWKLPNSEYSIATYTKPNWITRRFMKVVGWYWKEGENP